MWGKHNIWKTLGQPFLWAAKACLPWEEIQTHWRHIQVKREEIRLLDWEASWKPRLWTAFDPYGYHIGPHPAIKGHIVGIALSHQRFAYYRGNLDRYQRRMVATMILMAIQRTPNGLFSKPYAVMERDLTGPDGPEDNGHWEDWMRAHEYLVPMAYVQYLVKRYPDKAQAYIAQTFDVSQAVAARRIRDYQLWLASPDHTLFGPMPVNLAG